MVSEYRLKLQEEKNSFFGKWQQEPKMVPMFGGTEGPHRK